MPEADRNRLDGSARPDRFHDLVDSGHPGPLVEGHPAQAGPRSGSSRPPVGTAPRPGQPGGALRPLRSIQTEIHVRISRHKRTAGGPPAV